jgi:hypothetical protein
MAHNLRTWTTRLSLTVMLLLGLPSVRQAQADGPDDAVQVANGCSTDAVRRLAQTSHEAPKTIANRAFDDCVDLWAHAAHLVSLKAATDPAVEATKRKQQSLNGFLPNHAYLGLRVASDKLRADFVRSASRMLPETYGPSASSGSLPPGAGPSRRSRL